MAIANVGDSQQFSYTGGMQTFTAPVTGVYKLEVIGAKGGHSSWSTDGKEADASCLGGYGCGYKMLKKGDVLHICCGGYNGQSTTGGYNGGGGGASNWSGVVGGAGGGATHIATMTGTLAEIGKTNLSKILIVAGGAGGGSNCGYGAYTKWGGNGGGETGKKQSASSATPGTQSSGNAFGQGGKASANSYWDDYEAGFAAGGGGGGLYGGTGGGDYFHAGAGGSGYIGGVPAFTYKGKTYSPSWTTGSSLSTGNGYAVITFMVKGELPVIFNGTTLEKLVFDGVEIESLIYDGTKIFAQKIKNLFRRWRDCLA